MTPLQEKLYRYLWERPGVWGDSALLEAERMADGLERRLRQELAPAQRKLLESLLEQKDICADIRAEAVFCAALTLGRELAQL